MGGLFLGVFDRVFVVRLFIGAIVTVVAGAPVAFGVADWVVTRAFHGYDTAMQALQTNLNQQVSTIERANQQLGGLTADRDTFAREIALEFEKIRMENADTRTDLTDQLNGLIQKLGETNERLDALNSTLSATNAEVKSLNMAVTASQKRQEVFEQFVLSVLLRAPERQPISSEEWYKFWDVSPDDLKAIEIKGKDLQGLLYTYKRQ